VINHLINLLPPTKLYNLKSALYRWCGVNIGTNVRIVSSVNIWGTGTLRIGENTFIGHETLLLIGGGIVDIGANVDISSRVTISNGTHKKSICDLKAAGEGYALDINIGDGCWIGLSSTFIAGCNLGNNCIVAAGALAKGNYNPKMLVGGVPAKEIKNV